LAQYKNKRYSHHDRTKQTSVCVCVDWTVRFTHSPDDRQHNWTYIHSHTTHTSAVCACGCEEYV